MDVKQVVDMAKKHVKDLFENEGIYDVGLEEIEFDDHAQVWNVTIGFSRPWDKPVTSFAMLAQQFSYPKRSFKIVRIDDASGRLLSLKNREIKS